MHLEANSQSVRGNRSSYLDVVAGGQRALVALVGVQDLRALEAVEQGREDFWKERHDRRMQEMRTMRTVLEEDG